MYGRKKGFLAQIDRIVPWGEWVAESKPCYYKGESRNKPCDLERMLRSYMLQNLYDLPDMGTVADVIDSRAFSEFCGVDSSSQVPGGDPLGRFRHILEENGIQQKLFAQVIQRFMEKELIVTRNNIGKKIKYKINGRPSQTRKKSVRSRAQIRRCQHEKSSVGAKAKHVFGVVKGQFGYRKTRYRWLRKQTAKLNMLFALENLILADRPCLAV